MAFVDTSASAAKLAGTTSSRYCSRLTPRPAGGIWHNIPVARRQTLIQLDDARIAALDERAGASGRSRSELIREAIDLLLGTGDSATIDDAIVAGYERRPAQQPDTWTV